MLPKDLFSHLAEISAYQAERIEQGIKLDAMESPWSALDLSPQQLYKIYQQATINRYPDSIQQQLRKSVAEYFCINSENIIFGNGSDELINLTLTAIGQSGDQILTVEPTFSVYESVAKMLQKQLVKIPLNADFSLPLKPLLKVIKEKKPTLIILVFPNNPTGNQFNRQEIELIIKNSTGIVVIDEAYFAFADDSFLHDVEKYDNLIIFRTFSKVGLAGLRLGILYTNSYLQQQINKIRMPYNINTLTQLLIVEALTKSDNIKKISEKIIFEKNKLIQQLNKHSEKLAIKIFPSHTNFILFRTLVKHFDNNAENLPQLQHQKSQTIWQSLRQKKIYIKNLSAEQGLLNGCLRVTVGKAEENQQFIDNLLEINAQLNG